ncbi:MAG: hypothetical protein ACLP9L_13670 [Thermoguttaceae bacterium]
MPDTSGAAVADRVLKWIELAAAVVIVVLLVALHAIILRSAGGLWRDEINSVNLVRMPISEVWKNLQYDSFPMLWLVLLKGWIAVFGYSAIAVRSMGLVVGLGIVAALWRTSRLMGGRPPLLALAIFGLAPTLLTVGDSVRAYGLGSLLIILATGSMWRLVQSPTRWHAVEAGMLALLSVQCLYQNCIMLFAIGCGCGVVALGRRDWKLVLTLLCIGLVAAASVLPYLPTIARINQWNIIIKFPVEFSWLLGKFIRALDPEGLVLAWLWAALGIFASAACVWELVRRVRKLPADKWEQAVFVLVTTIASLAAYAAFLKHLSYPTQAWYYLPIMSLLAVLIEAATALVRPERLGVRLAILIVTIGVAMPVLAVSWRAVAVRQTNVDLVAAKLESLVSADDYVIVNPFYYGVSFAQYYHGKAAWTTVPDIGEHYIHRYDLYKAKMAESEPITPILEKTAATLRSGRRLWLVGQVDFPRAGEPPVAIPPAPNSTYGWNEGVYSYVWSRQVGAVILQNATDGEIIPVPTPGPVNPFENAPLVAIPKLQRSEGQR